MTLKDSPLLVKKKSFGHAKDWLVRREEVDDAFFNFIQKMNELMNIRNDFPSSSNVHVRR